MLYIQPVCSNPNYGQNRLVLVDVMRADVFCLIIPMSGKSQSVGIVPQTAEISAAYPVYILCIG